VSLILRLRARRFTLVIEPNRTGRQTAREPARRTFSTLRPTAESRRRVSDLDQRLEQLTRDPAITSFPDPQALLQRAETSWTLEQTAAYQQTVSREPSPVESLSRDPYPAHEVEHGPSIGR
jgi:hypothetical protein